MTDKPQPASLDTIYPVGEKQPERVRTRSGRRLADLTLDNLLAGEVAASDFAITAEGLRLQASIAEQAGRPNLAQNLRRGAEMVDMPDEVILEIYEQLRPGRAHSAGELHGMAERVRRDYAAEQTAGLIEEAA
ncbi:MAG: diol dehydratase small subunit, partial [Burkholderiaceae bacterium]